MKKYKQDVTVHPLFKVKHAEFQTLFHDELNEAYFTVFSPKDKITVFHQPLTELHFLIQGKAKLYLQHADGQISLIQFLSENDLIGDLTLIEVETTPKEIMVMTECLCLTLPMTTARKLLLSSQEFSKYMMQYLGNKLLKRTTNLAQNQTYPLKNRLAAHILLTETNNYYTQPHTETSEYLGVSYRHLLHTFKLFQEEKLLTKTKEGYLINHEALHELATIS